MMYNVPINNGDFPLRKAIAATPKVHGLSRALCAPTSHSLGPSAKNAHVSVKLCWCGLKLEIKRMRWKIQIPLQYNRMCILSVRKNSFPACLSTILICAIIMCIYIYIYTEYAAANIDDPPDYLHLFTMRHLIKVFVNLHGFSHHRRVPPTPRWATHHGNLESRL